jgi:hypothetical protein
MFKNHNLRKPQYVGFAAVSLKSEISFVGSSVLLPIITEHYGKYYAAFMGKS